MPLFAHRFCTPFDPALAAGAFRPSVDLRLLAGLIKPFRKGPRWRVGSVWIGAAATVRGPETTVRMFLLFLGQRRCFIRRFPYRDAAGSRLPAGPVNFHL